MTKLYFVFGVLLLLFVAISDYRGMVVSQLFGSDFTEQKGGTGTSRGYYHK